MTEAEWNLINGTLVHLKQSVDNCESCHLDMDYTFIKEIVENNRPFEVEAGKEYVAKFKTQLFVYENNDKENDIMDLIENDVVRVIDVNKVYTTLEDIWNISTIIPTDQFKACFKPLENSKN